MVSDNGGPAFPNPALANEAFNPRVDLTGMTLRDFFAAQCVSDLARYMVADKAVAVAYSIADCMLKERQA